jgi:hypothetical protein
MWNKELTSRPPFRRRDILNLPECGAHELHSKLKQFLVKPGALRVLQDNEPNQIVYAE